MIDLRLAWLFVFIDAIVYLFGEQRLPEFFKSDRLQCDETELSLTK